MNALIGTHIFDVTLGKKEAWVSFCGWCATLLPCVELPGAVFFPCWQCDEDTIWTTCRVKKKIEAMLPPYSGLHWNKIYVVNLCVLSMALGSHIGVLQFHLFAAFTDSYGVIRECVGFIETDNILGLIWYFVSGSHYLLNDLYYKDKKPDVVADRNKASNAMFAMIASYSFSSWNNGAHYYASSLLSLWLRVTCTIYLNMY